MPEARSDIKFMANYKASGWAKISDIVLSNESGNKENDIVCNPTKLMGFFDSKSEDLPLWYLEDSFTCHKIKSEVEDLNVVDLKKEYSSVRTIVVY